jgi:iron complex transport system substrate-binding protein
VAALPGAPGVVSGPRKKFWNGTGLLFLDLSNLQLGEAGRPARIKADRHTKPQAVRQGRVFGVLPYNWYSQNFGSIWPMPISWQRPSTPTSSRRSPEAKADEIYTFLVGKPCTAKWTRPSRPGLQALDLR